jgi:outer membrane protein OmpA-like peptidoglycan-associated protein
MAKHQNQSSRTKKKRVLVDTGAPDTAVEENDVTVVTPAMTGNAAVATMSAEYYSDRHSIVTTKRWIRRDDPEPWGIAGWLPVIGLVGLFGYGVSRFANSTIESNVVDQTKLALNQQDMRWVKVSASGQMVTLRGVLPVETDREKALVAARAASCKTWSGQRKCAIKVREEFTMAAAAVTAPAPVAQWQDYRFVLDGGKLFLRGEVPSEAVRALIVRDAQGMINAPRVTAVVDELKVQSDRLIKTEYPAVLQRGVATLGQCKKGISSFTNGAFSIRCELPQVVEPTVRANAVAQIADGKIDVVELVPSEVADTCDRDFKLAMSRSTILFASGKAIIALQSQPLLQEISKIAQRCTIPLLIEGHTDNAGLPASNVTLSELRATAVRDALVKLGVNASLLTAKGYGQEKPIVENTTPINMAKNRRIEIKAAR